MTTFVQTTGSFKQGAQTLPGEYYNSTAIFEEERERLFARQWICVGRAERLATPGSTARLIPRGAPAPAARGSSLDDLGRLLAP